MKKQANYQKYKSDIEIIPDKDCNYIGESYTQALRTYQKFTEQISSLQFQIDKIPTISTSQKQKVIPQPKSSRSMHLLMNGQNKGVWIKVRSLRALHFPDLSFMLVIDEQSPHRTDRYLYLAVVYPSDASICNKWKSQYIFNSTYAVFNPFKRTQKINENYYIISRLENILTLHHSDLRVEPQNFKNNGNLLFKSKLYVEAIYRYELSLTAISNPFLKKQRAILYSNTAACFHEMRLYNTSIEYAKISIQIDPTYTKGFYRKLNSLMEAEIYKSIPHCLLKLSTKIPQQEYEVHNSKYSDYLGNQVGVYNWLHILKDTTNQAFGQYESEKIDFQKQGNAFFFTAIKDIQPFELILVNKPIMYNQLSSQYPEDTLDIFMLQAQRYLKFQRIFYDDFRELPCVCHPEGMQEATDHFQEESEYRFSTKQMLNKLHWAILIERNLQKTVEYKNGFGVWNRMFNFKHECMGNCSYFHLKSGMFIFSARKIKCGESLTLDTLSYLDLKMRPLVMQDKYKRICSCQYCKFPWNQDLFGSADILYFIPSLAFGKIKKSILNLYIKRFLNWSQCKDQSLIKALKLYFEEIKRETDWEDLHTLINMLRECKNQQWIEKIRPVVKSGFEKYMKVSSEKAEELLTLII